MSTTTVTYRVKMNSIQFHRRGLQHDNQRPNVHLSKMRDCSTRTEATVSSSLSEYDIEETEITCNANISFNNTQNCFDESDGVDSVLSHVSSVPGRVRPQSDCGDEDDDLSFAPLDDDDDDDSSFAPLDDENNENSYDDHHFPKNYRQDCPFDEEGGDDDTNLVSRQHNEHKKYGERSQVVHSQLTDESTNSTRSADDVNSYNENQFIQQKTLPGLNNSYKVVCVSFMEYNIATSVACKVLDESLRMLRPGGLLYIIDKGGCTVKKHPTMRQWLSRVRDPTVKHLIYEIETRAILQANGFVHTKLDENNDATTLLTNDDNDDWEDEEIVRWIGIKQ
jgi:hypothetical protein